MQLRSKLIRRLLVLAIGFALLCGGAGGFYVYRKSRIRRQFEQIKAQGLAAAAEGNNGQAVGLLQLYLQRQPNDVDALVAYAHVRPLVSAPNNQQIRDTIYVLRHLLNLPHQDTRIAEKRQLLDLYVRTRYWTEAESLAQELLPDGTEPGKDDAPIVAARTAARMAQRDWHGALVWARQWSALAPTDLQAQITLLNLVNQTRNFEQLSRYAKLGKLTEVELADGLASDCERSLTPQSATTTAPSQAADPRPSIIRGRGLLLSGKAENVAQAQSLLKAAAAQPMDAKTATVLIHQLEIIGDSPDAMSVLRQAARQEPDPQIAEVLARRSWEMGDWASAVDATSQLNASDSAAGSELLALRASSLQRLNRPSDAAPILKALAARHDDLVAKAWAFLLDPANAAQVDFNRMSKLCADAAEQSGYLCFFLADAEGRLDEPELAIADCQKATQQNLTWVMPPTRLSELLADAGRYEEARQAGREAVHRQATYGALVSMYRAADLCLQNGLATDGVDLAQKLSELQAELQKFPELQKLESVEGQVLCLRADVLGTINHIQEAAGVVRDGLKAGQKTLSQQSLLRLSAISRKYKLGAEEDCLAACKARFGMTPQLAYAAAIAELAGGNASRGGQIFQAHRAIAPDRNSVAWRLAWARYLDLAQDPGAAQQIIQLADDRPEDVQVQLQALAARSTMQDRQFMQRTIDRVQHLMGENNVAWRLAKARWLLNDDKPDQSAAALNLLNRVVEVAPNQPEAHVLLSLCKERQGNIADAIDEMRVASRLLPGSPFISSNLARLLVKHGDFEAARLELTRVSSMPGSDPVQRRGAAILAASAGDPHLALMLAQEASSQSAAGPLQQDLLLAEMYWNSGNAADAERICRKLLDNKPDLATVRFASELYAAQGRLDEATQTLALLDRLELAPGIKQLVWADFSGRYVSPEAALKQLEQARQVAANNPEVWRALISFYVVSGQAEKMSAAIEEGCKRLPTDPGLKSLHEQEDVLATATADPNLRLLAIALAAVPSDRGNQQILQTLVRGVKARLPAADLADQMKQLTRQYPQSLPVCIYLAQCVWNPQHPQEGMSAALQAAAQFPAAPEPQKLYVSMLVDQKPPRWQEVLTAAQKWRDRSLSHPVDADMEIAHAYIMLKQPADALRQLDPYIHNAQSAPKAYPQILTLYAQASQAAGNTGTAALMEPLLDQGPRGRQAWILFAVRNLEAPEAAAWLDRVEKLIPPEATADRVLLAGAWTSLAVDHQYPTGFDKSLAILEPLAAQTDPQEQAVLACAVAEEQAGRISDAEAHYRQVLKLAPSDVVAINNLAMLLARSGKDLQEAFSLIQSALKFRPDVPSLYDTKAFVQGKMRHYDDAVASAHTAIEMQPQNVQYRVTLAQLLLESGNREAAAQALHDLEAQRPDDASESPDLKQQLRSLRAALVGGHASAIQPAALAGRSAD